MGPLRTRIVRRLAVVAAAWLAVVPALAQVPSEVKFAVVAPLSGPWGRAGQFIVDGARMAVDEINRAGEPYMPHEAIGGYGDMWVLKEAVEQAGSIDRVKVGETLHRMNLVTGPAAVAYPGGVRFADNGLRTDARILLVQWQHGTPVVVAPAALAVAEPIGTRH